MLVCIYLCLCVNLYIFAFFSSVCMRVVLSLRVYLCEKFVIKRNAFISSHSYTQMSVCLCVSACVCVGERVFMYM